MLPSFILTSSEELLYENIWLFAEKKITLLKKKIVSSFSMDIPYLPVLFLEVYPTGILRMKKASLHRVIKHC